METLSGTVVFKIEPKRLEKDKIGSHVIKMFKDDIFLKEIIVKRQDHYHFKN